MVSKKLGFHTHFWSECVEIWDNYMSENRIHMYTKFRFQSSTVQNIFFSIIINLFSVVSLAGTFMSFVSKAEQNGLV